MNKFERVKAALEGKQPDRIPYGVWTHFPGDDLDPDKLAGRTEELYRYLDMDFVKTMPNGLFSVADWGCECDFSEIAAGGVAKVAQYAIQTPSDWLKLKDLDVERGSLGRELQSARKVLDRIGGEAPVLATVFSPLTTAQKLAGPHLLDHMQFSPEKVKAGLERIADVTLKFANRAIGAGCAGVYFASQMSNKTVMSEALYKEFGVPGDRRVLDALDSAAWCNVVHAHGNNIMFDIVAEYPVQGVSWHVWETEPTVGDFLAAAAGKCIVGGLRRHMITEARLSELAYDIAEMRRLTQGRRLLLAPGCVIRAPWNKEVLRFLRDEISKAAALDL